MTIESFKKMHRSCWVTLQYVGLQAAGVTALHKKLLFGGKLTLPLSDTPRAEATELLLNYGGATNKILRGEVKKLFKNEVLPILAKHFPEISEKHTGKIKLHFREGRLTTFTLTH